MVSSVSARQTDSLVVISAARLFLLENVASGVTKGRLLVKT